MPHPPFADLPPVLVELARNDGRGVAVAACLVALVAVVARRDWWRRVRVAVGLLALHLLTLGAEFLAAGTPAARTFDLFALFFLLACVGQALFVLVVYLLLARALAGVPKILVEMVHGLVFAAAGLYTLGVAGVSPGSLLTGSALVTAVIGLSLRDTLGNLFAGLAIQAQRPFAVGDWIQFDDVPSHIGEVVEINWRATTVVTLDAVEIIVPNATLGLGKITNFTRPQRWSRRSVYVHAAIDVPPQRVQAVILEALRGAWGVRTDPPPSVVTNAFDERGVQYWVRFFTDEFSRRDKVDGGARDRIWYALARNGLTVPAPQRQVRLDGPAPDAAAQKELDAQARRARALHGVDFFAALGEDVVGWLASMSHSRLYAAGEAVIRQGEDGAELFVVQTGTVAVLLERSGEPPAEVARLGPSSFFGEMSLLTGEPRTATVQAATECEVLVVDKATFGRVLSVRPELAERVSDVVAHRQAALDRKHGEPTPLPEEETLEWRLLKRIREFFAR